MDFLLEALTNWLKEMLVGGIMSNLSGMFDSVNQQVADISVQVGQTPQGWNGSIFSMIENLSNSIMVPIAGVILAIVMTVDLIQMIADKNNLHDVDTWMIFKWVFKSAAAILIVTNTWNIVMGVFDMAQSVVAQAAGIINSDASIDISSVMTDLEPRLMEMDLGPLFGLWFQSLFIGITMWALYICIFIVIYGRMIEIYLVTSVAPIPMAAMMGKEWGGMGQNYLRSLLALGFQAFLIIVCVAIYAVLVQNIALEDDIIMAINLHDVDTWMIFKWVFKSAAAILIVTNTWNIVMGVFDMAQSVVAQAAGIINSDASIDISSVMTDLEPRLMEMDLGPLFGLWFQSLFIGITMWALYICIFIVIYGRMIEIYLVTSVAPIPMAAMMGKEWGGMGQNYLRSLLALGFQAFLIIVCVAIYAVLVQNIALEDDIIMAIWSCVGYTVLLCFTLFKTGSLAKSVFQAH